MMRWILANNPFRYDVNMSAFGDIHLTGFLSFIDLDLTESESAFLRYWSIKDEHDLERFEREAPPHVVSLFRGRRLEEPRSMGYQEVMEAMKPNPIGSKASFLDSMLDTATKQDPSDIGHADASEYIGAVDPGLGMSALDLDPSFIKSLLPAPSGASRIDLLSPMQFTLRGNLLSRLVSLEIFGKHSRSPSINKLMGRAMFTLQPYVIMADPDRETYEQRVQRLTLYAATKILYRHSQIGWHIIDRSFLTACKQGLTQSDIIDRNRGYFPMISTEESVFIMR
jgi:hypothetical protein